MRFEVFFKIDNIPLDQDPDSNWAKILDPDPNSMYVFRSLDLEHCLQLWSYQDEQALKTDTINLSWLTGTWDHAAVVTYWYLWRDSCCWSWRSLARSHTCGCPPCLCRSGCRFPTPCTRSHPHRRTHHLKFDNSVEVRGGVAVGPKLKMVNRQLKMKTSHQFTAI